MKVKCISDCEGDFRFLTVGKEYEILTTVDMAYGYSNGKTLKEKRHVIIDDLNIEGSYPIEFFACFELWL